MSPQANVMELRQIIIGVAVVIAVGAAIVAAEPKPEPII